MSFMTEWADRHPDADHPFFGRTTAIEVYANTLKPDGTKSNNRRSISEREEQIIRRLAEFEELSKTKIAKAWGVSVDTIYRITSSGLRSSHDRQESLN